MSPDPERGGPVPTGAPGPTGFPAPTGFNVPDPAPPGPLGVVGIGVDVVDVVRMRGVLGRRPRFAERVFTEAEREYAMRFRDPAKPLAARFAAKEAAMKAMGVGLWKFPFHDVEVTRASSGQPGYRFAGRAAELAASRGVVAMHLSLTHEETVAVAFAVALG